MHFSIKVLKTHIPILLKSEIVRLFPSLYFNFKFHRQLAIIIITHRCNLRCIMCKQWAQNPDKELSTKDWKSTIWQLKKNGISNIHFTGGEPLLRNDLCDLISYSAHLKCKIGVTTNGYLLTEILLEKLIASGLNSIAISIDAVNKEYEDIRGVGNSYSKVESALKLLSQYKTKNRVKAYINFTLMKPSLPHFYSVKKLAESLQLPIAICLLDDTPYFFNQKENRMQFWLGDETAEELNNFIRLLKKEREKDPKSLIITSSAIRYINKYFRNSIQKEIPCIVSQVRVFIDPYGKVMGGCLAKGVFGNLKDSTLREILGGRSLQNSQRDMFYKKCPGCSCGYLYNLQHHLPSLLADIFRLQN